MTALVLDASAAVRIVVGPRPEEIVTALESAEDVIAPSLFAEEAANALWKYVHTGVLAPSDAVRRVRTALSLPNRLLPVSNDESFLAEVFNEACRVDHPVYDLIYFVTARRNGATLATCDHRLAALASSHGVPVIT